MTNNSKYNNENLHFVGIGGAGSNIVELIYKKGIKAKYTIITNPERLDLPSNINFIEYIPKGESLKVENKEIRLSDFSQKISIPEKVKDLFIADENFVLLAGFGGYTGTLMTIELIEILGKNGKTFFTFCSLPFNFEGQKRKSFANEMKEKQKNLTNFSCVDLESIRDKYGDLALKEAFEKADEEMFKIIENKLLN
jgi:cell division GTPase FtsZ